MHPLAIFTAIDGTLLDAQTFEPGAAFDVLQRLHALSVPVVPVTVMTLEEVAPIADALGLHGVMIIEAGGGIARRTAGGWQIEPCGPPVDVQLDIIRGIEDRSGASLLVYSALPLDSAERVSGRSGASLEASIQRRFSEPFMIESGSFDDVVAAAADIGFSIRRGRRFLHLWRESAACEAFSRLRDEVQCEVAIGVGGSLVDATHLDRCDISIIIPDSAGRIDEQLRSAIPHAQLGTEPAPLGWASAVDQVVQPLVRSVGRGRH